MIDVRSDTVTRPDSQMRQAMVNAEVGDDVYGEDPSVNRLEAVAAEMLGQESALFMPSGTQSNLVALLCHCQRGDEYIVGADAHTYKYEAGGAAVLGSIQPQTVPFGANGELPLDAVQAVIKPDDPHFARSRLLCLENTQHGRVQGLAYLRAARAFAQAHTLRLHLDGARMANAAVALGVGLDDIAGCFDSVSLCLSKGLGAPVGSLLLGERGFIEQARRWRKMTGGGLRQAGVLAAAGLIALVDNVQDLARDHELAAGLCDRLLGIDELTVREGWTQTNMVWVDFDAACAAGLQAYAHERGVLLSTARGYCRLVIHRDLQPSDVEKLYRVLQDFFRSGQATV